MFLPFSPQKPSQYNIINDALLWCVKPKVIPAKSTGCIHVSFTPFNLSESQRESRCVGVACGFLNLNSEVTIQVHNKHRIIKETKYSKG